MNILWITNITFPEAQQLLKGGGKLNSTGGWMLGAAESIVEQPDVKLYVASIRRDVKKLIRLEGEKITYYILPTGLLGTHRENRSLEPLWRRIKQETQPDVIHLHGTELTHGFAFLEACGADHFCVSIQGLLSAYYYYYYGITRWEAICSMTLNSLFKGGILCGARSFQRRSEIERNIIRKTHHIIGRTSWDKDRTWAINPNATYHFGEETLRKEFYCGEVWNYEKCNKHTIFLSQAGYPVKGLHMVLRALPLVQKFYPDTKVRIAGKSICNAKNWLTRMKLSNYGNFIYKMIGKFNLRNAVSFTGPLDAEGMKREYLSCNVFICPSTIENSPNSLGEAQILGVPVLASYVGGIPDMMRGDESHLYRFEEVEMLASKICEIFAAESNQPQLEIMRKNAAIRHNPEKNAFALMETYRQIVAD